MIDAFWSFIYTTMVFWVPETMVTEERSTVCSVHVCHHSYTLIRFQSSSEH